MRLRSYSQMFADTWRGRHIFSQLVRRDLLLRTETNFLGLFWSLSQPLLWLVLFSFLHRASIFVTTTAGVPYPVYAFTGIIHWQLFVGVLVRGSAALAEASNLVSKVRLPRETLIFARCTSAVVDWLFALPVLALLMWWQDVPPTRSLVLLPLLALPIVLLATSLALVVSIVALPFRDILSVLPLALTPLMFVSSVLYASPPGGAFATLNQVNPMITWLAVIRAAIYGSSWPDPMLTSIWCVLPPLLFFVCWRFFFLVMPRVAEHA